MSEARLSRHWPSLIMAGAGAGFALPARAECLGQGCYSGLGILIIGAVICALVLAGVVLWVAWKWRPMRWILLLAALAALITPLILNQIGARRIAAAHAHDITGTPPLLADRVPLLINARDYCDYVCMFVVKAAGERGIVMITEDELQLNWQPGQLASLIRDGRLDLSAMPLELWRDNPDGSWMPRATPLSEAERRAFLATVDYVVLAGQIFPTAGSAAEETSLDAQILAQIPLLAGLEADQTLRLGMAPLPVPGVIEPGALSFDLLEIAGQAKRYPVPIFWGETVDMDGAMRGEVAGELIRSACQLPLPDGPELCKDFAGFHLRYW